jgi:two-component system NtrC family sensor kinase
MRPIAFRLMVSFLLIIVLTSAIFSVVAIQFIGNRVVAEAQNKVDSALSSAWEIYQGELANVYDVVRFSADRFYLRDALLARDFAVASVELAEVQSEERLDVLAVTDPNGVVLLRTTNSGHVGDSQGHDLVVRAALDRLEPAAGTSIVSAEDLRRESPALAERAYFEFVETPRTRARQATEETSGMMLRAAAPIFDRSENLIGVLYGGVLLNRRYEVVDKVKETFFQDARHDGQDIGTATIFQDDVRISTNVRNEDGTRATGTRVTEEVYDRVVREGGRWIGRAYVVNNRYISAYEPIRDIQGDITGILYVGILEEPYIALRRRTTLLFLAISLGGALFAIALAGVISRKLSVPIKQVVYAARAVARGNLHAKVAIRSSRELAQLADAFNSMASALRARDENVKEFARKRIMESERLAMIGQLAADVAHELNNPLQGIVAYSHLLLEKTEPGHETREPLQRIVGEADRATGIIRGLLDFSRPKAFQKKPSDIKAVLQDCVSLVESRALFHNIEIVKEWEGRLPRVIMDAAQIQQVFMNMIINAAEAMDGAGRLEIAARWYPASQAVEVEFTDTGHGISEKDLERIFDPFFTTKEVGHGTGLGLAISYGIVKEHAGTIYVKSEVGRGTTFTVRLPVVGGRGEQAA